MELGPGNRAFWSPLSASARAEWLSLRREGDAALLAEGMLNFAQRQEREGHLEAAVEIYHEIMALPVGDELRARARGRLDAVLGRGAVGARAEFLLRRLAQEAAEPSSLLAMGLAGAAYRVTRLVTLSRLCLSPSANLLTRGLGARLVAGLAGFAVEAPVFTLSGRLAAEALGRDQDWSVAGLRRDLASSFLVLGALKFFGSLSGAAYRRFAGGAPVPSLGQQAFQQAGMLSGILVGHGLERWAGLRRPVDGATTLVDSLVLLLQFNLAGSLTRHAFGEGFATWERGIDLQAEALASRPRLDLSRGVVWPRPFQPAMAGVLGRTGSRVSEAGPRTPGLFAMTAVNPETGGAMGAEAGRLEAPSPEHILEYPPEVEARLARVEAQLRAPDYFEGNPQELLAKRADAEAIDQIWFHQVQDLARRFPYVQVSVRDDRALQEPLNPERGIPDAGILGQAVAALGPRGEEGALSRQVLELRFPRANLKDGILSELPGPENGLVTLSSMLETQQALGHRAHFISEAGEEVVARLPSLSLLEKIFQAARPESAFQFHYVEGAVPRDLVMRLRAQGVTPVGVSRHQVLLGDIRNWVLPAAFTLHDAFFHGALDFAAEPKAREFAGRLYDWVGRERAAVPAAEALRDGLSDGDFQSARSFPGSGFSMNVGFAFNDVLESALREVDPFRRNVRLRELNEMQEALQRLVGRELRRPGGEDAESIKFSGEFLALCRRIRYFTRSKTVYYSPELRPIVAQVERAKAQPGYLEGTREELFAKRVDIHLADRLWFYLARDFAGRIPDMAVRELDASVLLEAASGHEGPPDRALIEAALDGLANEAPAGSQYRRVLELSLPPSKMILEDLFASHPYLKFLAVMPFANDVEKNLQDRLQLLFSDGERVRYRIPSLSLLEKILQGARGAEGAQFHFVDGVISRDDTMRLKAMRVFPVGLSASAHFFGEYGGSIHPFTFSQHDAFEHAVQDSGYGERVLADAGSLYFAVRDNFPASRFKESLLDDLSGVYLNGIGSPRRRLADRLLFRIQEAANGAASAPDPREAEARFREALGLVAATEGLIRRGFPPLQALQRNLIRPLAALRRRLERALTASRGDGTE
ncbi:MAG: hypothetical protein U1F66_08345 [bacterium]